jgi:hypothetical protein
MIRIVVGARQRKQGCPGVQRFPDGAFGLHQQPRDRGVEAHFLCRATRCRRQTQRVTGSLVAFAQQRKLIPQRQCRNGQRDCGRRLFLNAEAQVQCGAHVVNQMAMSCEPRVRRRGVPRKVGRLHRSKTLSCMPARICRTLSALVQLLQCVGACRLEQAVSGDGRFEIDDQERFSNEIYDAFQCVIGAMFNEDPGCFCDRKEPCEYGEPAQDEALALRQELIAPVQCGVECLVTGQRGASAAHGQAETVVENARQTGDAKHVHTSRGHFDRQRDPVESATDISDCRRVRVGQREFAQAHRGAFDEELHGGIGHRNRRGQAVGDFRHRQRRQAKQDLPGNSDRLAARRENTQSSGTLEERLGE